MQLTKENRKVQEVKARMFLVGIFTLVTVVVWIGYTVYTALNKTTEDAQIKTLIKPLNPNLDSSTLINYEQSRVSPPDTFVITAIIEDSNTVSQQTINPFE